jgi:hypothetical protein
MFAWLIIRCENGPTKNGFEGTSTPGEIIIRSAFDSLTLANTLAEMFMFFDVLNRMSVLVPDFLSFNFRAIENN